MSLRLSSPDFSTAFQSSRALGALFEAILEKDKKCLLHVSLLSRSISASVLDVLWRDMDAVAPLLRILEAASCKSVIQSESSKDLIFVDQPSAWALDRLYQYSSRIRKMVIKNDTMKAVPISTLFRLSQVCHRQPQLFALLQSLRIEATDSECLYSLFIFLSPSLENVEVHGDPNIQPTLQSFIMSLANVESRSLKTVALKGPSSKPVLETFIRCHGLERLDLGPTLWDEHWVTSLGKHNRALTSLTMELKESDSTVSDSTASNSTASEETGQGDSKSSGKSMIETLLSRSPTVSSRSTQVWPGAGPRKARSALIFPALKVLAITGPSEMLRVMISLLGVTSSIEDISLCPIAVTISKGMIHMDDLPFGWCSSESKKRSAKKEFGALYIDVDEIAEWVRCTERTLKAIGIFNLTMKRISLSWGYSKGFEAVLPRLKRAYHIHPPSLTPGILTSLPTLSALQTLEIGNWSIPHDRLFKEVVFVLKNLREVILPVDTANGPGIGLEMLASIVQKCPQLVRLEVNITIPSVIPHCIPPAATSSRRRRRHGLQMISTGEWVKDPKQKDNDQTRPLSVARYINSSFPLLQEFSGNGEWKYVSEILQMLRDSRD
ncbi:hypothetical protein FA15DRAFT_758020 [Coprinopsis marcescibilis]|uniref:F-box domain-containing protein n=1 Tax=Coprinopsis marcescibilis TaxID=230819 RepID=A0A5C3KPJ6_COPMA|nr:hypothetical protein FA15DRAFT_758020 [Coprinopsis marcescibilis]